MEDKYQLSILQHLLSWFPFSHFRKVEEKRHDLSQNKISESQVIPDKEKVDMLFILNNIEPE